jgi:hypothetical protein
MIQLESIAKNVLSEFWGTGRIPCRWRQFIGASFGMGFACDTVARGWPDA